MKIVTTQQAARCQAEFSPKAKLTFQALRMFLNQEMQQLDALLEAACETLLSTIRPMAQWPLRVRTLKGWLVGGWVCRSVGWCKAGCPDFLEPLLLYSGVGGIVSRVIRHTRIVQSSTLFNQYLGTLGSRNTT